MKKHLTLLLVGANFLALPCVVATTHQDSQDTDSTTQLSTGTLQGYFADMLLTNDLEPIKSTLTIGAKEKTPYITPTIAHQAILVLSRSRIIEESTAYVVKLFNAALAVERADIATVSFAHVLLSKNAKYVQLCLANHNLRTFIADKALEKTKAYLCADGELQLLEAAKKTSRLDIAALAFSYIAEETDTDIIVNSLKMRDTDDGIYLITEKVVVTFIANARPANEQLALIATAAETAERPEIVELLTKLATAPA